MEGISAQGLLAIDLMLDESEARSIWKVALPNRSSFEQTLPFCWEASLEKFLPNAVAELLVKQKRRLDFDWALVSAALPSLSFDEYRHHWFIVGTRTFYYRDSTADDNEDPEECLALLPFADLFNHSNEGCEIAVSSKAYSFTTKQKVCAGEELFISYGQHSNDFLLAEYGFLLEDNEHDAVSLDPVLLDLFDAERRKTLESSSFWANYTLGTSQCCYRTEVAVRLLCMPLDTWQELLKEGFDEDDNYRAAVDGILQGCLEKYHINAQRNMEEISKLHPRFAVQQAILTKRWNQISLLLSHALDIVQTNKTEFTENRFV